MRSAYLTVAILLIPHAFQLHVFGQVEIPKRIHGSWVASSVLEDGRQVAESIGTLIVFDQNTAGIVRHTTGDQVTLLSFERIEQKSRGAEIEVSGVTVADTKDFPSKMRFEIRFADELIPERIDFQLAGVVASNSPNMKFSSEVICYRLANEEAARRLVRAMKINTGMFSSDASKKWFLRFLREFANRDDVIK